MILAILASAVVSMSSPAAPGAAQPFLTNGRNGDILFTWIEGHALRFSRLHDKSWSKPQTIVALKDLVANWADFPSIAEDRDGVLYAQWIVERHDGREASDARVSVS